MKQTIIIIFFALAILFSGCSSDEPLGETDTEVGTCNAHWNTFNQAVEDNNPSVCDTIDDGDCKNSCLYNYGYASGNNEYCDYGVNPLMAEDVSSIELCVVNSAIMNDDDSICTDYDFNVNGFGYFNYRSTTDFKYCYNTHYENGTLNPDEVYCASINPNTYCSFQLIVDEYSDCDALESDDLKDACYLKFVKSFTDPQNPDYIGNLPFDCDSLKTEEGKSFCQKVIDADYRISESLQS